jgi:DNA processing protein
VWTIGGARLAIIIDEEVESRATRGADMTDLVELVALSLLPPWYGLPAAERLRGGDSARNVLDDLAARAARDEPDKASVLRSRAAAAIKRAASAGIQPIAWNDPVYPFALTTIADPPPVLWVRGDPSALSTPSVAIVGSRAASPYGLAVSAQLAGDVSACDLAVVSGLARGIDSAAHRGALDREGITVAVLGSAVDVIYPAEHAPLARAIEKQGAVVSELVPGTPPQARFFPRRNRIISGLARAVVIVEANEKSGSLITARCALEQGRDVLAVPGSVLGGRNRGAHALLRDGAAIVESADDILEELGMGRRAPESGESRARVANRDPLLECLTPGEACDLDAISERSGLNSPRLLPRLFDLELQGLVRRVGGGRFVRIDRTC